MNKLFTALLVTFVVGTAFGQSEHDFDITQNAEQNGITITGYRGTARNIVIPATIGGIPVTSIGERAFAEKQLRSVTIPASVTSIGDGAFAENQLTNITIPNSVISIGNWVFRDNQLSSVIIPDSVTSIGDWAFSENKLTGVTIPNSVSRMGNGVFSNNQLTNVTISSNLTSIREWTFANNQLSSVTIPDSVTSISMEAFVSNQLRSITIPNSVTIIGSWAFGYNQLTSVTIPDSVSSIGERAFARNPLTVITLGTHIRFSWNSFSHNLHAFYNSHDRSAGTYTWNGRTWIADLLLFQNRAAFDVMHSEQGGIIITGYRGSSHSIVIPATIDGLRVTGIGERAFANNQITSIIIPSSVTSIGEWAFSNNPLTVITLGANVSFTWNSFPHNLHDFYFTHNKIAGTYTWDGQTWTVRQ